MRTLVNIFILTLLLGWIWTEAYQVPSNNQTCKEDEYYEVNARKCCSKCPPGTFTFRKCKGSKVTQCAPCAEDSYMENWNYARQCMKCRPCDDDVGFVVSKNCSSTMATVCDCKEGLVCRIYSPLEKCEHCGLPTNTLPEPTEIPTEKGFNDPVQTEPGELTLNGVSFWIFVPVAVAIILLGLITFLFWKNSSVLKKIGRTLTLKSKNEVSPSSDLNHNLEHCNKVNEKKDLHNVDLIGHQSSAYISLPSRTRGYSAVQMEDNNLRHPVQETVQDNETDCGISTIFSDISFTGPSDNNDL